MVFPPRFRPPLLDVAAQRSPRGLQLPEDIAYLLRNVAADGGGEVLVANGHGALGPAHEAMPLSLGVWPGQIGGARLGIPLVG